MVRPSSAAGIYYPSDSEKLKSTLKGYLKAPSTKQKNKKRSLTLPYGTYDKIGQELADAYHSVAIPRTVIIIGTKLSTLGAPYTIPTTTAWRTPLGEVPINRELSALLMENIPFLRADDLSFLNDHTIEIHLPFLQTLSLAVQCVPLLFETPNEQYRDDIQEGLSATLKQMGEPTLCIVSSNSDSKLVAHVDMNANI